MDETNMMVSPATSEESTQPELSAREPKNRNDLFFWVILVLIAVIGFALDWYTKFLAVTHLVPGRPVPIIGPLLQFVLVFNRGGLFGMDPRQLFPWFPLNGFFFVFTLIALVLVVLYYRSIAPSDWLMRIGIALIVPGALGNIYDRVLHMERGVIDFIMVDLGFWPFHPWPIFNVADIYITIAVSMILLAFLRDELRARKGSQPDSGPAHPLPKK